jgi:glycosyltransferase involved in cell wall biosynthesis
MNKVFLICSGLGKVQRGYESFTQECFEALQKEPSLEVMLFKGGGISQDKEFTLSNIHRGSWLADKLSQILKKDPYFIEQLTFCLSLIPHIYQKKPQVIFFSDFVLGTMLWHLRRVTGLPFKLLFSNGAPNGPPFSRTDCVQQLTPTHYQMALDAGESADRHFLVPYGIKMSDHLEMLSQQQRTDLCHTLGLPSDRPILLSVAAINKTHKRMDYLIREVAQMPLPRPFLLLLGHQNDESIEIVNMGNQLLGKENFRVKTVALKEVSNYYQVANIFILASLSEGFGRVFLEAMSYGLPCLAHDYAIARYVLGEHGYFANFELSGTLTDLLNRLILGNNESHQIQRHHSIYERFSWDKLLPSYIEMIHRCIAVSSNLHRNVQ